MSELIDILVICIDVILLQIQCEQCGFYGCCLYVEVIVCGVVLINCCLLGGVVGIVKFVVLFDWFVLLLDFVYGVEKLCMLVCIVEVDCIGCIKCVQVCLVDVIVGVFKLMYIVLIDDCIGCELCVLVCLVDCIVLELMLLVWVEDVDCVVVVWLYFQCCEV